MRAIGIDIGGTFTDIVLWDTDGPAEVVWKTPSTPGDPSEGLIRGVGELAATLGESSDAFWGSLDVLVHGTTVATNALLASKGAKVALLTTDGVRDVLEMRRGVRSRTDLYDNRIEKPPPLIPRYLRFGVEERLAPSGAVLTDISLASVEHATNAAKDEGVEALAICFMHSYANPAHEQLVEEAAKAMLPGTFISVSSRVLPQPRLYERVSTTVVNAYVGPIVRNYVAQLEKSLLSVGFDGVLLIMQSNGGVATSSEVKELPARVVLSGPAAGPVAAAGYARQVKSEDCILVDMGGTSFDTCLIRDGEAQQRRDSEVGGYAVALPAVDVYTIGAGGGSIGWVDGGGLLHVGPESAGAEPGPVAYGHGNTRPTVTDADIVLGLLNPEFFLGGRMHLDSSAAEVALEKLGAEMQVSAEEAAIGVHDVVNLNMANGVRQISITRGYDPRQAVLVVAGGAGSLHGVALAAELGLTRVVVPRTAAVLCARGMLESKLRQDVVRAFRTRLSTCDLSELCGAAAILGDEVSERLIREAAVPESIELAVEVEMRYSGQHHELPISLPLRDMTDGERLGGLRSHLRDLFEHAHEQMYGFTSPGEELEIHAVRVKGYADQETHVEFGIGGQGAAPDADTYVPKHSGSRRAYLGGRFVEAKIFSGPHLLRGAVAEGPAIIEEETTSIAVPEKWTAMLADSLWVLTKH